jgi:molybdenum cofactor guanylyltransferase
METPSRPSDISAVILAGGLNSRVSGKNKSFLRVLGEPMIDRVLKILKPVFREIIIVTNKPEAYSKYRDVCVTSDLYPGAGPLGGLHAGLAYAKSEAVFLISSDMPFLSAELIRDQMLEYRSGEILFPLNERFYEPMHSIIPKSYVSLLDQHLSLGKGKKLIEFLRALPHRVFVPSKSYLRLHPFKNINTYRDLEDFGIKGYVRIVQSGTEESFIDRSQAVELGEHLAFSGWGMCAGAETPLIVKVLEGMNRAGGLSKLVQSEESAPACFWPLVEKGENHQGAETILDSLSNQVILLGEHKNVNQFKHHNLSKTIVMISGEIDEVSDPIQHKKVIRVASVLQAIELINQSVRPDKP